MRTTKKLMVGASLLFSIVLLYGGCVGVQTQEETIQYPHDFIPTEVVNQVEDFGYTILGTYVSDTGGIVVFVDDDLALLYIPHASDVYSMTHNEAMQVYQELCVEKNFCNNNPYLGEGENLNEI